MAVKQLAFEADARAGLLAGVEKLAAAVKPTLGPRGRNAIPIKAGAARRLQKTALPLLRRSIFSIRTRISAQSS